MTDFEQIFQKGSKTFYNSTFFFPPKVRLQVTRLYAFVRRADDYVDAIPQDTEAFSAFKDLLYKIRLNGKNSIVLPGKSEDEIIVDSFVDLEKNLGFDLAWTDAFLDSMEKDLSVKTYQTLEDTKKYIYGSANVIGLYMAKIMELPPQAYKSAESLGQAFQFINFIRDIAEDIDLGRNYFPQEMMQKFDLKTLKYEETSQKPEQFMAFVKEVVNQYLQWQNDAELGFKYIPKRYRIAIKTAADMYHWTAQTIASDPFIVYKKKVKPSKFRIISIGIKNLFFS